VASAEAEVAAARATLAQLQEQRRVLALQVSQAAAQQSATQAEQRRAAEETARQAVLLPTALGLPRRYDDALSDSRRLAAQARAQGAQREERRLELPVLAAQEARAVANVDLRVAQLDLARLRLSYTVLRAPADGMVGTRAVRVGTLLEPGTEVVPLTPLDRIWLVASFSERQLTDIRPGQPALVRLDAFPDRQLAAHVAGVSPLTGGQLSGVQPDNSTGNYTKVVQRIPVKIVLDNDQMQLAGLMRPGMSALVRVQTDGAPRIRVAR
jgi:membrane fusion protein (multidrug efflux system)